MRNGTLISIIGAGTLILGGIATWGVIAGWTASAWAAWGQWLGGVGSLGALLAAVLAVRAAWHTNEQQALQIRRLEEAQERELAKGVGFWITTHLERPQVVYVNTTGLPVHGVMVRLAIDRSGHQLVHGTDPDVPEHFEDVGVFPPTDTPETVWSATNDLNELLRLNVSGMFSDEELNEMVVWTDAAGGDSVGELPKITQYRSSLTALVEISVSFTDGNGMRWHRAHSGNLQRLGFDGE